MYTTIQNRWKAGKLVREAEVWGYLVQLLSALCYLHCELHIMHRDLKTQNVFMKTHHGQRICMIGDFGLAKKVRASERGRHKPHALIILRLLATIFVGLACLCNAHVDKQIVSLLFCMVVVLRSWSRRSRWHRHRWEPRTTWRLRL